MNRPLEFLLKLAGPYPEPWEDCARAVVSVAILINGLALSAAWLPLPTVVAATLSWLWPAASVLIFGGIVRIFAQVAALRWRSLAKADFSSPLKRLQRW